MSHLLANLCLFFTSRPLAELFKEMSDASESSGQQKVLFICAGRGQELAMQFHEAESGRES
ncbi:MAG: hypothetical protein LAQ69_49455, partial [Acidobacteriia bacterium]|nr:hypothetical protein [Terriglobia bacterium]